MKTESCYLRRLASMTVCGLGWSLSVNPAAAQVPTVFQVSTLAGGAPRAVDGIGSRAGFDEPGGIAVDSLGNIYVSDTDRDSGFGNAIRKITAGGAVTTVAGTEGFAGSTDGTGGAARFNIPEGLAVDGSGNIYVTDSHNHAIRKITSGGVVTTLAGNALTPGSADGVGSAAQFSYPIGVAVDRSGNVYVADTFNSRIRKITPDGVVTTLAGSDGSLAGTAARFADPGGLAVDGSGNIYVADSGNRIIRKMTPDGVVTTLAGTAGLIGSADGVGSAARFNYPVGVAVDSSGNVYVSDASNNNIRRITAGGEVTTVAGLAGSDGNDDGTGSAARFSYPWGIAVDASGRIYVADMGNNRIRVITPVVPPAAPSFASPPASQTIASGDTVVFAASASGLPLPTYQWQKDGVDIVGATRAMLVITRASGTNAGAYTVLRPIPAERLRAEQPRSRS